MNPTVEMHDDLAGILTTDSTVVCLPTRGITDWSSFHQIFKSTLGFPDSYESNLESWVDCMTYVDSAAGEAMTTVTIAPGHRLILKIDDAADFSKRCPEQFQALVDCSAFVNFRRVQLGKPPAIALLIT